MNQAKLNLAIQDRAPAGAAICGRVRSAADAMVGAADAVRRNLDGRN